MSDRILNNWNMIMLVPPLLTTIIICIFQDAWYLLILILPIGIVWALILTFGSLLFEKIMCSNDKHIKIKVMQGLNISNKEWRRFSNKEKINLHNILHRQEDIVRTTIRNKLQEATNNLNGFNEKLEFNRNNSVFKKNIEVELNKSWDNLSLKHRIELFNKYDIENEVLNKKLETYSELQDIKNNETKNRFEREKRLKIEQEKIKLKYEEKKQADEKLKIYNENKEKYRKIEEVKKQEQIIRLKEKRDEEYKQRIKHDIINKERNKILESDAIQELIDSGQLDENFSIQINRIPIPSYIKEAVWKRDKQQCVNCGSREYLEFDHDIPVSKGGSNSIKNIQLLCQKCNRTKTNKIM